MYLGNNLNHQTTFSFYACYFPEEKRGKTVVKKYVDNITSTKPGLNLKPGFTGVTQNKMVALESKN